MRCKFVDKPLRYTFTWVNWVGSNYFLWLHIFFDLNTKSIYFVLPSLDRICAIRPGNFSPILRPWDLNLTKLAVLLNALAQWCTSWCHQPMACVRTQGINRRGIMCLLDGVVLGVQAPYWKPLHEVAARSFLVVLAHEITSHQPWE